MSRNVDDLASVASKAELRGTHIELKTMHQSLLHMRQGSLQELPNIYEFSYAEFQRPEIIAQTRGDRHVPEKHTLITSLYFWVCQGTFLGVIVLMLESSATYSAISIATRLETSAVAF